MKEISVLELKKLLENKPKNALFIDVRTEEEFFNQNIEGFLNIPLDKIMSGDFKLDKEKEIYLICRSGGRSAMAQELLRSFGYENTYNVEGGILAYMQLVRNN